MRISEGSIKNYYSISFERFVSERAITTTLIAKFLYITQGAASRLVTNKISSTKRYASKKQLFLFLAGYKRYLMGHLELIFEQGECRQQDKKLILYMFNAILRDYDLAETFVVKLLHASDSRTFRNNLSAREINMFAFRYMDYLREEIKAVNELARQLDFKI